MNETLQAILVAAASFTVLIFIFAAILILCKANPRRRRSVISQARNPARTKPSQLSAVSIDESATFDQTLNHVSMLELLDVTGNFSRELIIGDGSFGLVYKARLYSGQVVAVKRLSPDAFQGLREFRAEMETLGRLRHPNIVRMLGYCATGSDRALIYEYIEKGSLDQWLYDTSDEFDDEEFRLLPLSWLTRIRIVRGVARGLAYMHNLETPIIHRDIKASNVLLDASFEAHIADFGLARLVEGSQTHVSTQVAGTMGYMPPEYVHGATMATVNGDVYSFGVLMLEIVTGRRPSFPFTGEDGKEVRLMQWIGPMAERNRYLEMVDASISRDDLEESVVVDVFRIGMKCLAEKSKERPSMMEVVEELDKILA